MRPRIATRCLQMCARLYPKSSRDLLLDDMVRVFDTERERRLRESGRVAAAWFTVTTLGATVVEALGERRRGVRRAGSLRVASSGRRANRVAQDARFGLRVWARTPGHAVVAVGALAVGIGVNVAVVSLIDTLFFAKPPARDADQVVMVVGMDGRRGSDREVFSRNDVAAIEAASETLDEVAAYAALWMLLDLGEGTEELRAMKVSGNFFELLDLPVAQGRLIRPEEDLVPGRDAVAVISNELWRRRFNASPAMLGTSLQLNSQAFTVVGVAPPGFTGLYVEEHFDVWIPAAMGGVDGWAEAPHDPDVRAFDLLARRAPGASVESVATEVDGIVAALRTDDEDDRIGALAFPIGGATPGTWSFIGNTPMLAMGVAASLLLVTCLNLAGLVLVRNVARKHEFATRRALGASRGAIIGQLLTEALVIAVAAAAVGVASAVWAQRLLEQWYAYFLPGLDLPFNATTVFAVLVLAVGASVALALIPAWYASSDIAGNMRRNGPVRGFRWLGDAPGRAALAVIQVALSLMLLTGAAVMLRSVETILDSVGGSPDGVLHYRLRPSRVGYDETTGPLYQRELLDRIAATAGVEAATLARVGPNRGWCCDEDLWLPEDLGSETPTASASNNDVTPGFFDTLKIPILWGRSFRDSDTPTSQPVVIVNAALAEQLWPDEDPVGKRVVARDREFEVVGLVPSMFPQRGGEAPVPHMYFAYWQSDLVDGRLYARTVGSSSAMLPLVRSEIEAVDPEVHIGQDGTLEERVRLTMPAESILFGVLRICAVAAVLLTALGLYGQLSLSVGQRTREIAVRKALGATRRSLLRGEVSRGLRLLGIGIVGGVSATWLQARLLDSYTAGVQAREPMIIALACAFLFAVGVIAAALPARRAAGVDPMAALRRD